MSQFLRPDSDISTGNWGSSPLWSKIDDTPGGGDSDSISTSTLGATCQIQLSSGSDPKSPVGHTARFEASGSTANQFINVFLRNGADDSLVSNALGGQLPTSRSLFEVSIPEYDMFDNPISDYGDLYIELQFSFASSAGTITVWNFELEIPDATPSVSWGDVTNPKYGDWGPVEHNGKIYALAQEGDFKVWLFESTNPSTGHNPSDWTPSRLVYDRYRMEGLGNSEHTRISGAVLKSDGTHLYTLVLGQGGYSNSNHRHVPVWVRWDPAATGGIDWTNATVAFGSNDRAIEPHRWALWGGIRPTNGRFVVGISEANLQVLMREWDLSSNKFPSSVQVWTSGVAVGVLGASDRLHFLRTTDDTVEGPISQRSVESNNSLGTSQSAYSVADRIIWGQGDINGDNLVCVPFRDSTSGIYAAVFTSGSNPTITEEEVTTRDAHKAEYFTNPVAVAVGSDFWVFWIDATSDSIWEASRSDGSWSSGSELQAGGGNSWDSISASLVDTDTVGILVSPSGGDIHYLERVIVETTPITKQVDESAEMSETDLSFVEEEVIPELVGWGIPIGIP